MGPPQIYISTTEDTDYKDAIPLTELHTTAPPSYHSQVSYIQHKHGAGRISVAAAPPHAGKDPNTPDTEAAIERTQDKILLEHVLSRRKELRQRRHEGDWLVDWLVTCIKTLTVVGMIYWVVWTAYEWWSLGPVYAPDWKGVNGSVHSTAVR